MSNKNRRCGPVTGHDYNMFQSLGFDNTSLDVRDTYLYRFAFHDFLVKLYAVYDVENLPDSFSKRLMFNAVFLDGVACVFESEKYGLLCQPCTFRDRNVNYDPVYAVVSNPYMQTPTQDLKIHDNCELIHFDLNYCSVTEWIDFFANLKAQYNAAFINQARTLTNPYIFMCDDDKIARSFMKLADTVSDGTPFIFADKNLFDMEGKLKMELFNKDFKKNFIAEELYQLIEEVEREFLQFIGVPRMYFKKKERMTEDEINKNDTNTSLVRDYFLDTLNESCKRVNKMFNTDMRFKLSENIINGGEVNNDFSSET